MTASPGTAGERDTEALEKCEVLLAMIGPRWLELRDQHGSRKIDNPNDLVRLEIELAMEKGIPVVPIVSDTSHMPSRDALPCCLKELAFRNAVTLRPARDFKVDVNRLVRALHKLVDRG